MRVLLVSANREHVNMTALPLGLALVAAATRRAGHHVAFLDLAREDAPEAAIARAIDAWRPEAVGVSVRNVDDQSRERPRFLLEQARAVVERCRACSTAPIVVGGAGYSIFPVEALRYLGADLGVAGDGEEAFPALLARLGRGEGAAGATALAGVHAPGHAPRDPRASIDDLDAVPAWDDALTPSVTPELWVPVQSRRGCPNACSYCSTARIQGARLRFRSPRAVAEGVRRLAAAGARRLFFVDNTFNVPEAFAAELCRELAAVRPRVQWRCIVYPRRVPDELVAAMAAAGCTEASLGFESGCPRILRELNKRFEPDDVRHTSDLLAAHGIRRAGFLLLGGPGETRQSVEESLCFARSLRLDELRVTVGIRIYPGTALARRATAEGVVAGEADLLRPSFYLAPGLEPWIHQRVAGLA